MVKIKPAPLVTTSTSAQSPSLTGGNAAASRQGRLQVLAGHGTPDGGTRIQSRNVSPLHDNPVLTPVHKQPNPITTPTFDDDLEAGTQPNEVPESDSESRSVLPFTSALPQHHQPAAEPEQPPAMPAAEGLRRVATRAVMGSIPAIVGSVLIFNGSQEDNDAMTWGGVALVACTGAYLTGMVIDKLVDRVMACCGTGSAAQ